MIYIVKAYDTDYGYVSEFKFKDRKLAEEWQKALLYDYGQECRATIIEKEDE